MTRNLHRTTLGLCLVSLAGACSGGAAAGSESALAQTAAASQGGGQPTPVTAPQPDSKPAGEPSTPASRAEGRTDELTQEMARRKAERQAQREAPEGVATEPQPDGNWLADASFEQHLRWDEGQPWWNPLKVQNSKAWVEFDIAQGRGRTGDRAAVLRMDSPNQPGPTRVHGVVQEVAPPEMPRYLSGWYLVKGWERGTPKQYLQAVVIANGPSNAPMGLRQRMPNPSVQVACTLAGVEEAPLFMANRRFEIRGPAEPVQGEWVFFECDLHELYTKHWREIPEAFNSLRVFFEVRYDGKQGGPPARATVYFDDVYLGDESRSPASESEAPATTP